MTKQFTCSIVVVIVLVLTSLCGNSEQVWTGQCWRKHNSGSIQTPDGEFKRPFGILCTYQCFLWFPPVFPYCEFVFDLRLSRHFTDFVDCYELHCNQTFNFFNTKPET